MTSNDEPAPATAGGDNKLVTLADHPSAKGLKAARRGPRLAQVLEEMFGITDFDAAQFTEDELTLLEKAIGTFRKRIRTDSPVVFTQRAESLMQQLRQPQDFPLNLTQLLTAIREQNDILETPQIIGLHMEPGVQNYGSLMADFVVNHWQEARIHSTHFANCSFALSKIEDSSFTGCSFYGCSAPGTVFSDTLFKDLSLRDFDLSHAVLQDVIFDSVDFTGVRGLENLHIGENVIIRKNCQVPADIRAVLRGKHVTFSDEQRREDKTYYPGDLIKGYEPGTCTITVGDTTVSRPQYDGNVVDLNSQREK